MPTTAEIIATSDASPLHLRPRRGLTDTPVSSRSRWTSHVWVMDNLTPGSRLKYSSIRWNIMLPDGSRLTDAKHADLLDALRRFAWSMFADPRGGKALKAGSASGLSVGIAMLTRWMVQNGYSRIDQLDAQASDEFREDLPKLLAKNDETDEDSGVTAGQAGRYVSVWWWLYKQGAALRGAGIEPMPEPPFGGRSAGTIAKEVATRAEGQIPPVPDEVATPILRAAIWLISTPADDVLRLAELYLSAIQGKTRWTGREAAREAITSFEFSVIPGETQPWHAPITRQICENRYRDDADLSHVQMLRRLIHDIRNAAVIVLQALIGMRINEICGLEGGVNKRTRLPTCIVKEPSRTGLHDLYYVNGKLAKTLEVPENVRWIVASTPRAPRNLSAQQEHDLPLPVLAIIVLERLYRPWREMAGSSALIISFKSGLGIPSLAGHLGPIATDALALGQKDFVRDYVDFSDLPDRNALDEDLATYRDTRGHCLKTHQWRKTFAHYVLLTRSNLLAAVSQHFKHLSIAMTEQAYIVKDPYLSASMTSAFAAATVDFFFQASTGKRLAGRFGELIAEHRGELEKLAAGDKETAYRNIARWIETHDLRIFHAEYGKCCIGILPTEARCHELAGTKSWANSVPNFEMRAPPICAGCACFAIDADNAPFWSNRYVENQRVYRQAKEAGHADEYTVARNRAEQALGILKLIGADVPEVHDASAA